MCGLRLSHYNFLLSDYSFFQFSWSVVDNVRYAYYPNPFIPYGEQDGISRLKRLRELLQAEMITYEEYLSILRDAKADPRAPLFRYENAPDQICEVGNPFAVGSGCFEAAVEYVGSDGGDLPLTDIGRQSTTPRTGFEKKSRINRSIGCRPHDMPSASMSCHTRLAP